MSARFFVHITLQGLRLQSEASLTEEGADTWCRRVHADLRDGLRLDRADLGHDVEEEGESRAEMLAENRRLRETNRRLLAQNETLQQACQTFGQKMAEAISEYQSTVLPPGPCAESK